MMDGGCELEDVIDRVVGGGRAREEQVPGTGGQRTVDWSRSTERGACSSRKPTKDGQVSGCRPWKRPSGALKAGAGMGVDGRDWTTGVWADTADARRPGVGGRPSQMPPRWPLIGNAIRYRVPWMVRLEVQLQGAYR